MSSLLLSVYVDKKDFYGNSIATKIYAHLRYLFVDIQFDKRSPSHLRIVRSAHELSLLPLIYVEQKKFNKFPRT